MVYCSFISNFASLNFAAFKFERTFGHMHLYLLKVGTWQAVIYTRYSAPWLNLNILCSLMRTLIVPNSGEFSLVVVQNFIMLSFLHISSIRFRPPTKGEQSPPQQQFCFSLKFCELLFILLYLVYFCPLPTWLSLNLFLTLKLWYRSLRSCLFCFIAFLCYDCENVLRLWECIYTCWHAE